MLLLKFLYAILIFFIFAMQSVAEQQNIQKITLAKFKIHKDGKIKLPKTAPYWPRVDRHILSVDDSGNIYILNLWNNEIQIFDNKGKISRKITLPGLPYKSSQYEPLAGEGYLEVSGDGERLYVVIPSAKGYILNKKGGIIRQFLKEELLQPFPDVRLCNRTYINLQSSYMYDENFKKIKENNREFSDSGGEYKVEKQSLVKYGNNGKRLWGKTFYKYFEILGIDKYNNIYLQGILREGDKTSIYKLNSKGEILDSALIPNPFPFLSKQEQEEWDARASEDFLLFFKLTCNGNIYLIFQLGELPKKTYDRWLKKGEYFIYKFEMKR